MMRIPRRVVGAVVRAVRHLGRVTAGRVALAIAPQAARRPWLAGAYFWLLDDSFQRENRAVLWGAQAFDASKQGAGASPSLLRRNVHRIEKGILARPRRPVFALDYIEETITFLEGAVARCPSDEPLPPHLEWARDVIREYFEITRGRPEVAAVRARFEALQFPASCGAAAEPLTPYHRDLTVPSPVSFDDLLALSWRRRSVRWFLPRPVPRELIMKAVDVARQSPSACNRQPFHFKVFDDPTLVPKVASLPMGTGGFSHQFPAMVVVIGEQRHYGRTRDRHLIYIDGSLAAMSFVYAAETLGLGTCCINWPDVEERERAADRVLRLEPDQRPIMFIAVGYPDAEGMVARSVKKSVEELCLFNFEGPREISP
jgi:nitroreductase